MSVTAFEGWAVIELMGHRQRVGFVKEVEIAGGKMLRVDIPAKGGDVTEFYGASAIYALRPCTEEIARAEMGRYPDMRPVRPLEYRDRPQPALVGGEVGDLEEEEDDPL